MGDNTTNMGFIISGFAIFLFAIVMIGLVITGTRNMETQIEEEQATNLYPQYDCTKMGELNFGVGYNSNSVYECSIEGHKCFYVAAGRHAGLTCVGD